MMYRTMMECVFLFACETSHSVHGASDLWRHHVKGRRDQALLRGLDVRSSLHQAHASKASEASLSLILLYSYCTRLSFAVLQRKLSLRESLVTTKDAEAVHEQHVNMLLCVHVP